MKTSPSTTFFRKNDSERKWFVVDATGHTLGRLASNIAKILRGKHKPQFTTNSDVGDFVVVVNAEKVKLTGKRDEMKKIYHNTGYPGGARFQSVRELLKTRPEHVMEHAVKGMIPKNRLGRQMIKKLKVYKGAEHPHEAQKPEALKVEG